MLRIFTVPNARTAAVIVAGCCCLALLAAAPAVAQEPLTRPKWPPVFTAKVEFNGNTWGNPTEFSTRYVIHYDEFRRALRLDSSDPRIGRAATALVYARNPNETNPRMAGFEIGLDGKCSYDLASPLRFERVVEDFVGGARFRREGDLMPGLWFPSAMRRLPVASGRNPPRTRADQISQWKLFETTFRSSPEPFVPHWRNVWASKDFCTTTWHELPYTNQSLEGCDAAQVLMHSDTVYDYDLVREVRRTHTRAQQSFDHSWEWKAKYDMERSTTPDAFDPPADWRLRCNSLSQRVQWTPDQLVVRPGQPLEMQVKLQEQIVWELGPVVIELRHGDSIHVSPSRLEFTDWNYDIPQHVTVTFRTAGSSQLEFRGRGGGIDLEGYRRNHWATTAWVYARDD